MLLSTPVGLSPIQIFRISDIEHLYNSYMEQPAHLCYWLLASLMPRPFDKVIECLSHTRWAIRVGVRVVLWNLTSYVKEKESHISYLLLPRLHSKIHLKLTFIQAVSKQWVKPNLICPSRFKAFTLLWPYLVFQFLIGISILSYRKKWPNSCFSSWR